MCPEEVRVAHLRLVSREDYFGPLSVLGNIEVEVVAARCPITHGTFPPSDTLRGPYGTTNTREVWFSLRGGGTHKGRRGGSKGDSVGVLSSRMTHAIFSTTSFVSSFRGG